MFISQMRADGLFYVYYINQTQDLIVGKYYTTGPVVGPVQRRESERDEKFRRGCNSKTATANLSGWNQLGSWLVLEAVISVSADPRLAVLGRGALLQDVGEIRYGSIRGMEGLVILPHAVLCARPKLLYGVQIRAADGKGAEVRSTQR
jgi:hypothetical protein